MASRRVLLVGIDAYHPKIGSLSGCVNDVRRVKSILPERFALTEVEELCDSAATRGEILKGLDWLVKDAQAGDVRVLYYSGHGTRLPNPRDPSGKDEAIVAFSPQWETLLAGEEHVSVLFSEENWSLQFIRDKEIKARLDGLADGVNLTLIMDCCHSGDLNKKALAALPRFLQPPDSVQESINAALQTYWHSEHVNTADPDAAQAIVTKQSLWSLATKVFKGNRFEFLSTGEKNILLAGCSEKETAMERSFGGEMGGVFTHHFLDVISSQGQPMTYDELIQATAQRMRFVAQIPRLTCPEQYRHHPIFAPL
jgi:hypothetical protein